MAPKAECGWREEALRSRVGSRFFIQSRKTTTPCIADTRHDEDASFFLYAIFSFFCALYIGCICLCDSEWKKKLLQREKCEASHVTRHSGSNVLPCSLKYAKVWKWLIYFYDYFWKLRNEPSQSVETKLFAMCAWKYRTDQPVWRKPRTEQRSGSVRTDSRTLLLSLYSVHCCCCFFFFLLNLLSFFYFLLFRKKSELKSLKYN